METEERIFRHSFGKIALIFLVVMFWGVVFVVSDAEDFFWAIGVVLGLFFVFLYSTSYIRMNNSEITVSRLFISKSLRWNDIARVSMRGNTLRLHSYDDVTLSLDSQVEGYKETLDFILSKRPDLFEIGDNDVMSRGLLSGLVAIGFGLLLLGLAALIYFTASGIESFSALFFSALGLYIIIAWFLYPQSIVLEDTKLIVLYFFREESFQANEIKAISLEKRRTRNGYVYFVQVNPSNSRSFLQSHSNVGTVLFLV